MPVLRLARKATELQQAGDVKRSRHRLVEVPVGQVDDAGSTRSRPSKNPGDPLAAAQLAPAGFTTWAI
ncbi:MAG: hypothetical protein WAK28_09770 [Trebonia sp.]